jgi:Asp-tRNA(Asn)/Glu-tRNA(Gln) amidotransferase C subunit
MILKPEPQPIEGVAELKHIEGMKEQVKQVMADLDQLKTSNDELSKLFPFYANNDLVDDIHNSLVSAMMHTRIISRRVETLRKDVARFAGMTREDAGLKLLGDFINGK